MKSTILLTAVTILAFNMNTSYKKPERLRLQDIGTYIQTIAAKNDVMISSSFMVDEDTFVSHAIKANMHEITMAQMASQKSTKPAIKALAQRLVSDYQQLLRELERLNNSRTQMNTHDSSAANSEQDMAYNNLSGNDFDRKWISDMIMGHAKALNEFNAELGTTQSGDLKNLITKSLPTISDHLRQLEALRNKMM